MTRRSGMGCRGGTSANAGRTVVSYVATLPCGRTVRKRSYRVDLPVALLGCYYHEYEWYISGIVAERQDWPGHEFVEARRVSE